jgi:hypothetical protein
MAEPTQTLYGDSAASNDILLSNAIEDSDTGAKKWRGFGGIHVLWDANSCFGAESAVFGVWHSYQFTIYRSRQVRVEEAELTATIPTNTIHGLVVTALKEPTITALTRAIMTAVPAATNTVSFLPALLTWADSYDVTNDFVARDEAFL